VEIRKPLVKTLLLAPFKEKEDWQVFTVDSLKTLKPKMQE
jgi:hypothetical protein